MIGVHDDRQHWRRRAEETRVFAARARDREMRRMQLELAEAYDRLAERATERLADLGAGRVES